MIIISDINSYNPSHELLNRNSTHNAKGYTNYMFHTFCGSSLDQMMPEGLARVRLHLIISFGVTM